MNKPNKIQIVKNIYFSPYDYTITEDLLLNDISLKVNFQRRNTSWPQAFNYFANNWFEFEIYSNELL